MNKTRKAIEYVLSINANFKPLLRVVRSVTTQAIKLDNRRPRATGGAFCLTTTDGLPIALVAIGKPDPEKLPKYLELALEKCVRLGDHIGHELSRQSEEPLKHRYAGAVRDLKREYAMGFSGFPALLDEATILVVQIRLGMQTLKSARKIAALKTRVHDEGNTFFEKLYRACNERYGRA